MSTQPPDTPQPPPSLWNAIPEIVKKLQNEFLLASIAYLLIAVAIGFFVPGVVDLLGRGFFYLIVVLAFLAYVLVRVLTTYERLRPPQPTQPTPKLEPPPPAGPPKERPSAEALRDRYLRELVDRCAHLQMTTIDIKAATRREAAELDLAAVFTDLDVHDVGWEEGMGHKVKLYENLYPQVYDWDNLLLAYRKASKGKRGKPAVATFEYHLEDNLICLQEELVTRTYQPGPYHSFHIHEPKRRLISAAPFQDRVAHHALCNVIEPIFERSFISDSYANRVGKGTHRALDRAQQFARRYSFVLPCDVRQFFPSIDHEILHDILARHIADPDVLWLADRILESGVGVLSEEYEMVYFPGDDLFAIHRPRGLPIGNLTSQFWANCYLNPFDHFVQRELRCQAYLRYVDDLLLFADDRHTLLTWGEASVERLARYRLTIHPGAHPRPVSEGFPFLGFVVYPTHRRLKRSKGIAYQRKLGDLLDRYQAGEIPLERVHASVQGWVNHVRYGDTWGLRRAMLNNALIPAVIPRMESRL